MTKEELVDLITNAIEVNPSVIEKRSTYPVYIEKYPNWNQRWNGNVMLNNNNSTKIMTRDTSISSEYNNISTNLLSVSHDDLINMCNNI